MNNSHGSRCVICNPVGSRNRRVGRWSTGLIEYSRVAFKRMDDLTDDDFVDDYCSDYYDYDYTQDFSSD